MFEPDAKTVVIGERMKATGRAGLAEELRAGRPDKALEDAAAQAAAEEAGLPAAIINPLEPGLMMTIRAAGFLSGKDRMGRAYLKHYRSHRD